MLAQNQTMAREKSKIYSCLFLSSTSVRAASTSVLNSSDAAAACLTRTTKSSTDRSSKPDMSASILSRSALRGRLWPLRKRDRYPCEIPSSFAKALWVHPLASIKLSNLRCIMALNCAYLCITIPPSAAQAMGRFETVEIDEMFVERAAPLAPWILTVRRGV